MTITLYINSSDKRVVNKSITKIKDVTGSIKTDCSLTNPQLELAYDAGILNCNYVYIPDFGRYYYCKVTASSQRVFLDCSCDVLKSFVEQVKNSNCIVRRSEQSNKYNLYLNDPYFMTLAKDITEVIHFPNDNVFDVYSYILTVAGPRGGV